MRMVLAWVGCCVVALVAGRSAEGDEPKPEAMKASDILKRVAKTYEGCKSYSDTGVVKTVFVQATGNRTTMKFFQTAFVRPGRFRFEYVEQQNGRGDQYIVWRDGKRVETWWDVKPGVEKSESLRMALAGATGVSGRSAQTVPNLLLPTEVWGGRFTDTLADAKRVENADLGLTECFRVEGKLGDLPQTYWIDKETFLVRRIDSSMKFPNFRTEDTTTYDPIVNEEVPDKALEFNPPKGE